MKTDKLLHLVQQKKAMRSGGALPLPKAQTGVPKQNPYLPNTPLATGATETTYSPIEAAIALISGAGLGPVAFKLSTELTKSSAINAQLLNEARQAYKNIISKQTGGLTKAQDGLEPINLKEVTISGAVPDNVQIQSNIAQSSNPKKNYAIIDKVGNRIYYYKPSGELIKSESVITGKSNNDMDRGLSMKEWFEQTGSDSHEDYFKYLEENKYQTTPSGIFKISGKRTNTAQDPSLLGRIINTFRPERAAQIRESRLRDYGLQQKMFTLADENKKGSSKAIHGTNNPVRVDAFNNPYADRNLSNGCINVQGETICFDTLGRGSNIYIMPEEQMGYLYPKEVRSNLAELFNRKQKGGLAKAQYGPPKQNPYLPNTPLATGAAESTMGPEALLFPARIPLAATSALGRGAITLAEILNPFGGLRPSKDMMYRGIGKEGFKDAMESGVLRAQQQNYPAKRSIKEIVNSPKQFTKTYYSPDAEAAMSYGKGYVAAVPKNAAEFAKRYGNKDWSWSTAREIPIQEAAFFKKYPVVGYKKMLNPKNRLGAQEIDKGWMNSGARVSEAQLVNLLRDTYDESNQREGGLTKAQYGWMTTPGLNFPRSSKPVSKKAAAQVQKVEQEPLEKLRAINDTAYDSYIKDWEKINVFPELSGRTVNLTAGRYKGSEVPIEYMRMLYESAKKAGVDPMQSLAQGARETIFLQDYATKDKIKKGLISPNPEYLISGWNVDEEYEPYDAIRFLADKQVPGIKTKKGTHGYDYTFDEDELNTYLKKNPQLIEQYISKVQSTPKLPQTNYFDLYHDFVKRKGVKGYNAGDPNYVKQVNEDIQLLQSDPEFMKYYAKGFKKTGGLAKAQNGLQYVPNGTYGNYYDPTTQQYIPQVYLPDVDIVADRELPFQNGKFAPFLASRGTAEYVPVESILLPGTPIVKGLGKVGNVLLDAVNPLAGMNVGKGLKNLKQEILYRGITPVGYGAKEKAKMFLPNLLKYRSPEDKVIDIATEFERGMNTSPKLIREIKKKIQKQYKLSPEEYKSLSAEEKFDLFPQSHFNDLINQSKKRVDAWRIGLGLDQVYDTFDVVDGKYRIKDSGIEPGRFSTLWNDIRASELKDKVYMGDNPLVSLAKKHQEITSPKIETPYGSYSVRDLMRYLSKEKEQLKPWEQTRIVEPARNKEFQWSVYDADPKGVMGQMRWDVSETPEGMLHWQANDTWDLHPWSRRGSINVNEDKLAELTRDLHRRKFLENVEVLDLLGGKPFDIQNNYIVDPKTMQIVKQWKTGGLTKSKAREILHDKSVHGNPLTEKQRKFFGAIASGKKKKVKVNKPR